MDFEKAFDSANRDSLRLIMQSYGLPSKMVSIMKTLYNDFGCAVVYFYSSGSLLISLFYSCFRYCYGLSVILIGETFYNHFKALSDSDRKCFFYIFSEHFR